MRIEFLSVCGGLLISQQMLAQTDSIANTQELSDVVVTATNGIKSKFRADNTEIIGKGQLIRAACCNLGESFTTNPSVDVSYSDAATGARQIKLLGLSGTYVQMLTENIPNLRGAALPYSLGYVPGPWMQSIQVSKGASSVKNGYESTTGQINIEFLKPQGVDGVRANVYQDSELKTEVNLDGSIHLNDRLSTATLLHFENRQMDHDGNSDGFMDMPKLRQYNLMHRWAYVSPVWISQLMLRGFLSGNAPGSSLTAFEELSLVPRRERECWVALMQPLRWKQGEEPWELSLLSTAVGNMSSEVFTPLQVLSVTVAIPAEQCLVLVLQSRVGEPLEADYITRQLNYLQSACAQYIHCEAAFYPEGPQPFEQASEIYQKLLQQRSENVALKGGVLLGRPAEKAPEVFRIPQIGAWQKLLQAGCAQAMEQEACQLLDKLTVNNQLNSQTLRYFYQDFMQMLFSFPEKKRQGDMFREPEALELYRNGMKTVPDMKALVHYVASVWDNETEENSQSTVEIIMAYIAEHLENELRREELAEAVHLNPDYMARLFKKETGLNLKDYIIQQKMQEAQSLLCTTNLPISLIAAKVGYTNFGHFSTSYKKFYHKTPQEERSAAL